MKHLNVQKFGGKYFKLKIGKMAFSWSQFSIDYSTQLIDSGCENGAKDN